MKRTGVHGYTFIYANYKNAAPLILSVNVTSYFAIA